MVSSGFDWGFWLFVGLITGSRRVDDSHRVDGRWHKFDRVLPSFGGLFFFLRRKWAWPVWPKFTRRSLRSRSFFFLWSQRPPPETQTHTHTHTHKRKTATKSRRQKKKKRYSATNVKPPKKNKILGAGTENKTAPRPAVTCKML